MGVGEGAGQTGEPWRAGREGSDAVSRTAGGRTLGPGVLGPKPKTKKAASGLPRAASRSLGCAILERAWPLQGPSTWPTGLVEEVLAFRAGRSRRSPAMRSSPSGRPVALSSME